MTFREAYKRWSTIDVDNLFADAVIDDAAQVVDANTAQLWEGKDARGQMLPLPYANKTIEYKRGKGQPTDRITLKDTGAFYSGFFVQKQKDGVIISSKDEKTPKLVREWGDIFGLTDKSKAYLKPQIIHNFIKRLRTHVMLQK